MLLLLFLPAARQAGVAVAVSLLLLLLLLVLLVRRSGLRLESAQVDDWRVGLLVRLLLLLLLLRHHPE